MHDKTQDTRHGLLTDCIKKDPSFPRIIPLASKTHLAAQTRQGKSNPTRDPLQSSHFNHLPDRKPYSSLAIDARGPRISPSQLLDPNPSPTISSPPAIYLTNSTPSPWNTLRLRLFPNTRNQPSLPTTPQIRPAYCSSPDPTGWAPIIVFHHEMIRRICTSETAPNLYFKPVNSVNEELLFFYTAQVANPSLDTSWRVVPGGGVGCEERILESLRFAILVVNFVAPTGCPTIIAGSWPL